MSTLQSKIPQKTEDLAALANVYLSPDLHSFSQHIHSHIHTYRVSLPDVSPPPSALQQRPAGSFQGSSPAWSTDRTQRCRSTQSPPLHCDLRSDPTDRPACPGPDCATDTKGQKLQFLAHSQQSLVVI